MSCAPYYASLRVLNRNPTDHRLLPPDARQLLRDDDHRARGHRFRLDVLHLRLGDPRRGGAAVWDLRHDHGGLWAVGCAALVGGEEDADCDCEVFAGAELREILRSSALKVSVECWAILAEKLLLSLRTDVCHDVSSSILYDCLIARVNA